MYCPRCGYMMSDFDKDCPRCLQVALAARAQGMPPPDASPTPTPSVLHAEMPKREIMRASVIGLAFMLVAMCFIGPCLNRDSGSDSGVVTTKESVAVLVDVPALFGKPVSAVEAVLGAGQYEDTVKPGVMTGLPGGGTCRSYFQPTTITVFYDKGGIARQMHLESPPEGSFNDHRQYLRQFGFSVTSAPDPTLSGPACARWSSVNGCYLQVTHSPRQANDPIALIVTWQN